MLEKTDAGRVGTEGNSGQEEARRPHSVALEAQHHKLLLFFKKKNVFVESTSKFFKF